MELVIHNNTDKNRFEAFVNGSHAYVEYGLTKEGIMFTHTEVPAELEGKGIGSAMAMYVLEYAKENQLKVTPLCPFIKAYMDRHTEYKELLDLPKKTS